MTKKTKKYRSKFEEEVSAYFPKDSYETEKIKYTIPATEHTYTTDFFVDGVFYELKGRFRNLDEARKYLYIRNSNPDIDLRFIIMDRKTKMPKSKTKTMYEWLEENGFKVYIWKDLKLKWKKVI